MTKPPQETYALLVAKVARDRDTEAFAVLFHQFAPRINGYLQQLGLSSGVAEDVAQEVMGVLWQKADLFDPARSSLATWLFRIARNRRIDLARRERSHSFDTSDPTLWPGEETPPDHTIDAARTDERVRAAVAELPDEQKELLRLAYFIGLSQTQIADRTGLPLGTVKSRFRLAFAKLRKALEGDPIIVSSRD
ncbi:sigma-70 family RNA polymerase sigma factor [Corticibacterium sp. UT-5YL-CI-8]|nr:sigma-70 family RNA polymerase sigma factor [Tianweitania sp. UT-5YL-CI-8]